MLISPTVGQTSSQTVAIARPQPSIVDDVDSADCVRRCLAGEPEAFRPIVERFQGVIYRLTLRLLGDPEDARELTQDTLLKAYGALASYDPQRRFATWLYRIAVNGCVDRLRVQRLELREDLQLEDVGLSAEATMEKRERDVLVQQALLSLPVTYRVAIVLKDIEGTSYSDMSDMLGDTVPALKIRVVRARKKLADRIRKMHPGLLAHV